MREDREENHLKMRPFLQKIHRKKGAFLFFASIFALWS